MNGATTSLGHFPAGRWEFDDAVTAVFDDMVARSVPLYRDFHRFAVELARRVVVPDSVALDVGCSTGNLIALLRSELPDLIVYGLDESAAMVEEVTRRFLRDDHVGIVRSDVTRYDGFARVDEYLDGHRLDAAFAILTLMFVAPVHRLAVATEIARRMNPGGVFVVVEKTVAESAHNERVFVETYHAFKRAAGYTEAEVIAKAKSLDGVLRPWTVAQTADVLREAGFRDVEPFAKWGPFAGLVARR